MKLSVVIPVYNSESTIGPLVHTLFQELSAVSLEVVLVNDCSKDHSERVCESLAKQYKKVKFVSLRKNSGEHNAVLCGLSYCTGTYAVIMDDDFQNPPSEVMRLLHAAVDGHFDVVYSQYQEKYHSFFRNIGSRFHNYLTEFLLNKPKKLYLSSFKILHRDLIDEVVKYKGPYPYIDALVLRTTNNIGSVMVKHDERKEGRSNYTISKLLSLYFNVFINYSVKPLRIISVIGVIVCVVSVMLSLYVIYERVILNALTPGYAFLALTSMFTMGMMFVVMGVMGEYISKMMMSLNQQPQVVIKKTMNVENDTEPILNIDYDRKAIRI
jgi:polyisoprenyl-phosphate glycosyltransferase